MECAKCGNGDPFPHFVTVNLPGQWFIFDHSMIPKTVTTLSKIWLSLRSIFDIFWSILIICLVEF